MTGEVFNTVKIPCSKVCKSSLMNVLKTNNFTNQAVYTYILCRHRLEDIHAMFIMGQFIFTPNPKNKCHSTIMDQEQVMSFGLCFLTL